MLDDRRADQQHEQYDRHHRRPAGCRGAECFGVDAVRHEIGSALRAAGGQCVHGVEYRRVLTDIDEDHAD